MPIFVTTGDWVAPFFVAPLRTPILGDISPDRSEAIKFRISMEIAGDPMVVAFSAWPPASLEAHCLTGPDFGFTAAGPQFVELKQGELNGMGFFDRA